MSGFWSMLKDAALNWSNHKDARLGAALAYYSVFSIGPLILIAIAIAGFFFGEFVRFRGATIRDDVQMASRCGGHLAGCLTAGLFEIGKFLIGVYIGKQGLESTYGAAASLVVLLIWVYYSSQIVLMGAEFSHVYAQSRRDLRRPTTRDNREPAQAA